MKKKNHTVINIVYCLQTAYVHEQWCHYSKNVIFSWLQVALKIRFKFRL